MGVYERILVPSRARRRTARCWSTSPGWHRLSAPRSCCCAWRTTTRATSGPTSSKTPRPTWSAPRSCSRSRGIPVRTLIAHGEPAEVILAQAAELSRTSSPWPRTGTAGRNASCWAAWPTTSATTATSRCSSCGATGTDSRRRDRPAARAGDILARHAPPRPLRHRLHPHRRPRRRRASHHARHPRRVRRRGRARRLQLPRPHRPGHHPRPRGPVGRGRPRGGRRPLRGRDAAAGGARPGGAAGHPGRGHRRTRRGVHRALRRAAAGRGRARPHRGAARREGARHGARRRRAA